LIRVLCALAVISVAFACEPAGQSHDKALPQVVETPEGHSTTVDVMELKQGPHRRSNLSAEQVDRVNRFREILSEVDQLSLEEHLDNLRRDINPDEEIEVWEHIAAAYRSYTISKSLDDDAKMYVLHVLLSRSGQSNAEVIRSLQANGTLRPEAHDILEHYEWDPVRLTVDATD
jgi:hypothetical protein